MANSGAGQRHGDAAAQVDETRVDRDAQITAAIEEAVAATEEALAATERSSRRLRLLADAGSLFTSGIEMEDRLNALAELVVPEMADHFILDTVDDEGQLRRRLIRHAPNVTAGIGTELFSAGEEVEYPRSHPGRTVIRTHKMMHIDITNRVIVLDQRTGAQVALNAEGVALHEVVVLPLLDEGELMGVLTLATSESDRRPYDADDLILLEEIAKRSGIAIGGARRYAQQRLVAVTLQRTLLPDRLTDIEGIEIAWRYEPGSAGMDVGGDFVDAFNLPAGRVGMVVGDVMGRGLLAAATMSQLRTSLRAYAALDWTPDRVFRSIDAVSVELAGPDVRIATCLYAIWDPATNELLVCSAGHIPPLVINDAVKSVRLDPGPPLGLGIGGYRSQMFNLKPGDIVALCSDGLVESRVTDLGEGLTLLGKTVLANASVLETACETAMQQRPSFGDDAVLLLARPTGATLGLVSDLSDNPREVSRMRARLKEFLLEHGVEPGGSLIDSSQLVLSEMITNSMLHGRGALQVRLRLTKAALHIEMRDQSGRLPVRRVAGPEDEGGRGLAIIDAYADRWGVRTRDWGKAVWASLRRFPENSARPDDVGPLSWAP